MDKMLFSTQVTEYRSTDVEGVGKLRWVNNQKCYRWVRNSVGATLIYGGVYSHGTAAFVLSGSTFAEEIFKFGQSGKGTALGLLAGVAISACPDGYYCWVQVYGYTAILNLLDATNAIAVGDTLVAVTAQTYVARDTATGTAPKYQRSILAVAASGTVSATTALGAFIRAM